MSFTRGMNEGTVSTMSVRAFGAQDCVGALWSTVLRVRSRAFFGALHAVLDATDESESELDESLELIRTRIDVCSGEYE